jgi:hypothetical protein
MYEFSPVEMLAEIEQMKGWNPVQCKLLNSTTNRISIPYYGVFSGRVRGQHPKVNIRVLPL